MKVETSTRHEIRALTADETAEGTGYRDTLGSPAAEPNRVDQLVCRARLGDKAAFGEVCALCEKGLFLTACRVLGNEADAMDAVQNAIVRSYTHLKRYDDRYSFYSWILSITVNEARRLLARRRRKRTTSLDDSLPSRPTGNLTRLEVEDALDRLPHRERMVFVLRYVEDRSGGEVAGLMNKDAMGFIKADNVIGQAFVVWWPVWRWRLTK